MLDVRERVLWADLLKLYLFLDVVVARARKNVNANVFGLAWRDYPSFEVHGTEKLTNPDHPRVASTVCRWISNEVVGQNLAG